MVRPYRRKGRRAGTVGCEPPIFTTIACKNSPPVGERQWCPSPHRHDAEGVGVGVIQSE